MEQRSEEWFKARKGRITASSVGAILGLSPFMAPDDVMRRMVREYHGAPSEFNGNVATEWGTLNEPGALAQYQMETGVKVETCGFYEFEDWAGASPDGLIEDDGLIEIKCPYYMRKGEGRFKRSTEQMHYYAQMQFQLFIMQRKWCHFYQWCPTGTWSEVVYFNQPFVDDMMPKLRAFHAGYLLELQNPNRHLGSARVDASAPQIIAEYDDTVDAIKLYEERKKELLAKLVEIAGNRDASFGGRNLTFVQKAGSISYAKAVKEHMPNVDLEPYRGKPSSYWLFS
jgi:putative phage-type endonuclease